MKIKIGKNRSVYPYRIKVSNQYENKTNSIEFDLDVPNGNKYLFVEIDGRTIPYPLENKFEISSGLSWTAGEHRACVVVSNVEIKDTINKEDTLFISDEFVLVVDKNFINPDDVAGGGLPEPLKILYDDLMSLKNAIEKKLQNGEFDGESAYQIAVRLGFKGTEQEWIDSLRYDHSEEFKQIALQVEQKATDAENAAQSASQAAQSASQGAASAEQAKTYASEALQSKNDSFISAQEAKTAEVHAKTSEANAKTSETNSKLSETNAKTSELNAQKSAESIQASAEQIEQNKLDIEDLRNNPVIDEKVLEKLAIKDKAQGNPCVISDSADWQMQGLNIYGQSEQASTTGAQLLSLDMIVKKLPFSDKGITFSDNGDGGIKVTGTATGTVTLFFNDMINNLEDGETYSYNSDTELGKLQIKYNDGTPIDYIKTVTVNKSKTISIEPYLQYASGNIINKVIYPMLNIGNSVKLWEPYTGGKPSPNPDYPQEIISKEVSEIKVSGKNLIGTERNYINYSSGAGYIHRKEVEVTLPYKPTNETFGIGYIIPCNEGETYTISVTNPNENAVVGITEYKSVEEMDNYLNNIGLIQPKLNLASYVAKSNGFLLCFIAGKWTDGKTTLHECTESELLQVEIGTVATSYGPYKEQTVTLSQPITLRGIPVSTGGNVTIDGKKYLVDYINSEKHITWIAKYVFTGNENFKVHDNGYMLTLPEMLGSNPNIIQNIGALSNRFVFTKKSWINDGEFGFQTNVLFITDKNRTLFESVDDLKNFLKTNETYIYYPVITPTEEPLPFEDQQAIKTLKSYYPNTVIQSGAFTECSYVADPKNYIDKKFGALNTVQSKLLELESKV